MNPGLGLGYGKGQRGRGVVFLVLTLISLSGTGLFAGSVAGEANTGYDWQTVVVENQAANSVEGRLLRGIAYANLGRLPEALKELKIAGEKAYRQEVVTFVLDKRRELQQAPEDLLLLNCAAFGCYAFGDFKQSSEYFEKIIRLDPQNIWAKNFAALVYGQMGDVDRALQHLKEAVALDSSNQYTHLLLSAAYKEKGQYLLALYHYLQAPDAVKELRQYGWN